MFDTYRMGSDRPQYVNVTHKNAPASQTIWEMRELIERARATAIEVMRSEDNALEWRAYKWNNPALYGEEEYVLCLKLNGRQHRIVVQPGVGAKFMRDDWLRVCCEALASELVAAFINPQTPDAVVTTEED